MKHSKSSSPPSHHDGKKGGHGKVTSFRQGKPNQGKGGNGQGKSGGFVPPSDPQTEALSVAFTRPSHRELALVPQKEQKNYSGELGNAFRSTDRQEQSKILDNLMSRYPVNPFPYARMAFFCAATGNRSKGQEVLGKALSLAANMKISPAELDNTLKSTLKMA